MKKLFPSGNLSTWLALLCAVHCALTPILISVTPVFASQLAENHWLEWLLLGTSIGLGTWPLLKGYTREHRNLAPGALFAGGFALILFAHAIELDAWEHLITLLGAALLIASQWYNTRLAHKCEACAIAE